MSVSFYVQCYVGEHGTSRYKNLFPEDDFNLNNRNASELLNALGLEDEGMGMVGCWKINHFRSLLTVARRKRLNHSSPEIPVTVNGNWIDGGREEGYIEQRLLQLSDLVNRGLEAGATHVSWS